MALCGYTELEPLDVVQVFDGPAGSGNVAVVGIRPAEDAESPLPVWRTR